LVDIREDKGVLGEIEVKRARYRKIRENKA